MVYFYADLDKQTLPVLSGGSLIYIFINNSFDIPILIFHNKVMFT